MAVLEPISIYKFVLTSYGPHPNQVSCLYCAPGGLIFGVFMVIVFLSFFNFLTFLTAFKLFNHLFKISNCYVITVSWWGMENWEGKTKI